VALLHLVVLKNGRALTRMVQVARVPDSEAELALTAREALGEVYLFEPVEMAPLARIVNETRQRVQPAPPDPDHSTSVARGGVGVSLGMLGGLADQRGASLGYGVDLAGHLRLWQRLELELGLSASVGPIESTSDGTVLAHGFAPRLSVAYCWWFERFAVGPFLELQLPWTRVVATLGQGDSQQFTRWNLRAAVGLEMHLAVGQQLELTAGGAVGLRAAQDEYTRLSDGTTVLRTPRFDWSWALGIIIWLS
jgi:hypothetical protein